MKFLSEIICFIQLIKIFIYKNNNFFCHLNINIYIIKIFKFKFQLKYCKYLINILEKKDTFILR